VVRGVNCDFLIGKCVVGKNYWFLIWTCVWEKFDFEFSIWKCKRRRFSCQFVIWKRDCRRLNVVLKNCVALTETNYDVLLQKYDFKGFWFLPCLFSQQWPTFARQPTNSCSNLLSGPSTSHISHPFPWLTRYSFYEQVM
jgi:hypothetical protein